MKAVSPSSTRKILHYIPLLIVMLKIFLLNRDLVKQKILYTLNYVSKYKLDIQRLLSDSWQDVRFMIIMLVRKNELHKFAEY